MNTYLMSIIAKVVFRHSRNQEWWPCQNEAEWKSKATGCIDSNLISFDYMVVAPSDSGVRVSGFNSLRELATVGGSCVVIAMDELAEVHKNER